MSLTSRLLDGQLAAQIERQLESPARSSGKARRATA
jgi:hypothetical protein